MIYTEIPHINQGVELRNVRRTEGMEGQPGAAPQNEGRRSGVLRRPSCREPKLPSVAIAMKSCGRREAMSYEATGVVRHLTLAGMV